MFSPTEYKLDHNVSYLASVNGQSTGYICAYWGRIAPLNMRGKMMVLKEIIESEEVEKKRMNNGGVDRMGMFWVVENYLVVSVSSSPIPSPPPPPPQCCFRDGPNE
jgi:hypothetical protein